MADEEERLKAEKLAAAKKRVAALQKKKKGKKASASTSEAAKDAKDAEGTESTPVETEAEPQVPAAQEPEADETQPEKQEEVEAEAEAPTPAPEEKKDEPPAAAEPETEPMPDLPTSDDATAAATSPIKTDDASLSPRTGHTRQPSLSIQSKMRSSSFRKSSVSQGSGNGNGSLSATSPPATLKSPSLPPLSADGEAVQEVYRKQSGRIEELERENKKLEKDVEEMSARFKKSEDQLEELREANVDIAELREQLRAKEEEVKGVEELKAEIASLQRQTSHLQTRTRNTSTSASGQSDSPPSDLVQQLESKSAAMESMELEISNLRAQVTEQSGQQTQITALEEKLSRSESALEKAQNELTDSKNALTRASEKAVKEGVDKTSTETLIKSLQRDVEELKTEKTESEKKIDTLEKKLTAMSNLRKESEARHQTRLRESEKSEVEAASLRKKLASTENENLRLKEEQEMLRKRHASSSEPERGGADDDALDELEDEERSRLQRRIRDLEGEVFDLRRGAWQEKRQEMQPGPDAYNPDAGYDYNNDASANAFDDVDLVGGAPSHTRGRSMAQHGQQHSSFSTVISSGLAAFTGSGSPFYSQSPSNAGHGSQSAHPPATRGSLELLSEENLEDEFDEAEFARAQMEEEARKRVEWVREIKKGLKEWNGWRLDLVDSRAGAEGAGVGMGEIFEI